MLGATLLPGLVVVLKRLHGYAAAAIKLRTALQSAAAGLFEADLRSTLGPLLSPPLVAAIVEPSEVSKADLSLPHALNPSVCQCDNLAS